MDGSFYKHNDDASLPDFVSAQLLGMAIQGWALERGLALQGIPAMPERRQYLPAFIMLLHRPDWQPELHRYAMTAHGGWQMREEIQRYFAAPDIHGQLVQTLARMAK